MTVKTLLPPLGLDTGSFSTCPAVSLGTALMTNKPWLTFTSPSLLHLYSDLRDRCENYNDDSSETTNRVVWGTKCQMLLFICHAIQQNVLASLHCHRAVDMHLQLATALKGNWARMSWKECGLWFMLRSVRREEVKRWNIWTSFECSGVGKRSRNRLKKYFPY